MTVTIEEAKDNLPQILARAQAGEEVLIGTDLDHPIAKLVPVMPAVSRLLRHPDLVGSTTTYDPEALVKPLSPEEWGELADA
jgi:antitoxin (DNA-binding transcriptional repressor) of toxin-antitoxin stability system